MKRIAAAVMGLALVSCSDDPLQVVVRNLDGPTDIAFACIGDLRLTETGETLRSAQPLASCSLRAAGEVPEGQEDLLPPDVFGFVLQSTRGTVAVVDTAVGTIADADPFAPGRNAIPIGTLPVGLIEDQSGCYAISANAGSCDLSVLDVGSAVTPEIPTEVTRVTITNAGGEVLTAKPRSIEPGTLQPNEIGAACPETASGLAYITFPVCNLVAAVDLSTGTVTGGIKLNGDGTATITDGNVTCPNQCGTGAGGAAAGGAAEAGAAQPVEVALSPDGSRLFIGSQNSPKIVVVDLDPASGLPLAAAEVVLEGEVGVTSIEVTDTVSVGGAFNSVGELAVDFQFAYAIATDGSIRVIDVGSLVECDTQVDPRYLRDETNIEVLGCLAVGDAATPPRRAGARGPGIRLPNDAVPLDLAIVGLDAEGSSQPEPNVMVGTFGFVTASDGNTFVINVDDDNYGDFEEPNDPSQVWLTLAVPHQLRDFVVSRNFIQLGSCVPLSNEIFELPPRLSGDVARGFGIAPPVPEEKSSLLPTLRRVRCAIEQDEVVVSEDSVGELSIAAPVAVRERALPDLLRTRNEDWFVTWEGSLSLDSITEAIDGRPVRAGIIDNNQGLVTVTEAGAPFCGLGVEPYDFIQLFGCDPTRGNEQCSVGESCYVHPDTPENISTGLCMP
ncbi:MAG: hypothetical protein KJO07_13410, partial [Deltaproteobacteria bacterium]|nr:hypothetical protein [Deltaproteobacteria bacterium]